MNASDRIRRSPSHAKRVRWLMLAAVAACLAIPQGQPVAQGMNARRMGMGGVMLGAQSGNVAYRAVPKGGASSSGFTLPIGLIPVLSDPPELDPDNPNFSVFEILNLVYNPPWNLQIMEPPVPSSDVVVSLGKDHLAIDLGEIADVFPAKDSRIASIQELPGIGFGVGPFFAAASMLAAYDNAMSLNPALSRALADGEEFQTNTEYALNDDARGQAAAMVQLGWAAPVLSQGKDPRAAGGFGLYAGLRAKALHGLVYADAENVAGFTTSDTLFSSAPVDVQYRGIVRSAGPGDAQWGGGLDLGLVGITNGFEVGIGLEHVATSIHWRVTERATHRDPATGDYVTEEVGHDIPFRSEVPMVVSVNASRALGRVLVAADVAHRVESTVGHVGFETWMGFWALRAGTSIDDNALPQGAGGVGVRFGPIGADLAIASHSRTVSRKRGLELAAGVSFYR